MFNQVIFGEKLKHYRKSRNFTQSEVAEKISVSAQAVSKWEKGECFHTALVTLQFLAVVSKDVEWIKKLIELFNKYNGETYRHGNTVWYYWLCLSELPLEVSKIELIKYKEELWARLHKSAVINSESDKIHQPVLSCILRNCLCNFPEYEYIRERQPYISEKDRRLYFDII